MQTTPRLTGITKCIDILSVSSEAKKVQKRKREKVRKTGIQEGRLGIMIEGN